MAKLSVQDVLKLARLARLELTEDELQSFPEELSQILNYAEQLQDADVKGLEPTAQVTGLVNVTREDLVHDYRETAEELLKNVPMTEGNLIKVKRIIG